MTMERCVLCKWKDASPKAKSRLCLAICGIKVEVPAAPEAAPVQTVRRGQKLADRVTLELPLHLPSLSNQRLHWAQRARQIREHRDLACAVMAPVARLWGFPRQLTIRLTRYGRRLDGDNLQAAFKGVRDGIADAWGCDDDDSRLDWHYDQQKGLNKITINLERRCL